jgi:hypothetical protein
VVGVRHDDLSEPNPQYFRRQHDSASFYGDHALVGREHRWEEFAAHLLDPLRVNGYGYDNG